MNPTATAELAQRNAQLVAAARQHGMETAPTADSLTAQQWYNVCKFWPFVAAHCRRPRPIVGPDHPLDNSARQGPLLMGRWSPPRRGDDPEEIEERRALMECVE